MDSKPLKAELEAAYKSLNKAEHQIRRLLVERKQNQLVVVLLERAGFITEGKLDEAKNIVDGFYHPTPPTEEQK